MPVLFNAACCKHGNVRYLTTPTALEQGVSQVEIGKLAFDGLRPATLAVSADPLEMCAKKLRDQRALIPASVINVSA